MINLSPHEWALATWRPLPDPPGEPAPFDRERAAARLRKANSKAWDWHWPEAPFADPITAQEASAWLRLTTPYTVPREAATTMLGWDEPPMTLTEALAIEHSGLSRVLHLIAVLALGPAEDVARAALEHNWSEGLRAYLLPRLEPAARDAFADGVRDAIAKAEHRGDENAIARAHFPAAAIGLHAELERFLDVNAAPRWRRHDFIFGLGSAEAVRTWFERLDLRLMLTRDVAAWIAHTERDALELVTRSVVASEGLLDPFTRIADGPEVARAAYASLRTSVRHEARAWLIEHPQDAAEALASRLDEPDVVEYLRARKRAGDTAAGALVAGYDEGEADPPPAVRAVLDAAPRKRLPAWLDVPMLPPLTVPGGRLRVPDVAKALALLAKGEPLPAGVGGAEAFGLGLFDAWLAEDAPAKDKWVLAALGEVGGEATVARLVPMIRRWPSEGATGRATVGLGVLGAIGSDSALMHLSAIAERIKFPVLRARARAAMEEIAAAKGLSKAELEDRIVPTCGLDEGGRRSFMIGARTFEFALGPGLKPMLRDDGGKLRASPPKPSEEWKVLRKQVADVAKLQAERLEQAMVTQRRWAFADFERFVVRHPLQRHLARTLIWRAGTQTFRITDELDYSDADDQPVTPAGEVTIVHPLQLSAAELAAWGDLAGDYELVPPFAQLGRPVFDVDDAARGRELLAYPDRPIAGTTMVRLLERLGWERGFTGDAAIFNAHAKTYPGAGQTVVAEYEPGVQTDNFDLDEQTLEQVYVLDGIVASAVEIGRGELPLRRVVWGDVDPIVRSEVLSDIHTILGKAS